MLIEPKLDLAVLAAALDREYGLGASELRFVPVGETAWCYQLTDERGRCWFCKLGRPGAIEPARAEFALHLAGALADLGLPVPRPRPTRAGMSWCWLDGLRLAVLEFIDGQPLSDQDLQVPEVAGQAARLVAAVHAATPALTVPAPFAETLEVSAEGLHDRLTELEAPRPQAALAAVEVALLARARRSWEPDPGGCLGGQGAGATSRGLGAGRVPPARPRPRLTAWPVLPERGPIW